MTTETEDRYEIIVRRHVIERTPERKSVKSRRFNIYQRVFDPKQSEAVIASLERVLNGTRSR
jgi:hypothetical protein